MCSSRMCLSRVCGVLLRAGYGRTLAHLTVDAPTDERLDLADAVTAVRELRMHALRLRQRVVLVCDLHVLLLQFSAANLSAKTGSLARVAHGKTASSVVWLRGSVASPWRTPVGMNRSGILVLCCF